MESKVILIYSGKGGVGKTTTTANIAKALVEQGFKVGILDADVNTPSMPVIFKDKNPNENLLIRSTGYEYEGLIHIQNSMIKKYLTQSIKDFNKFKPDYLLIDTPPSMTDVHVNLMEKMKISGVIAVTQPTEISNSDVNRTIMFFTHKDIPVLGLVENMVVDMKAEPSSALKILGRIPFVGNFDGEKAYDKHKKTYHKICKCFENTETVILENKKRLLFDETITSEDLEAQLFNQGARKKTMRFINCRTWEWVKNEIEEFQYGVSEFTGIMPMDRGIMNCSLEKIERLVNVFREDEQGYFIITRAPSTEIPLIAGEIGQASLLLDDKHYGIPKIKYHTSLGDVTLHPYEVTPATEIDIARQVREGAVITKDNRYLPNKAVVRDIYNTFGNEVGLFENWEEKYDEITGVKIKKVDLSETMDLVGNKRDIQKETELLAKENDAKEEVDVLPKLPKRIERTMRAKQKVIDVLSKNSSTDALDKYLASAHEINDKRKKVAEDKEIEPNDITDLNDAGWLAPNGDWYGLNGVQANYLHNQLADMLYKAKIVPTRGNKANPDVWLEKHGWLKVHGHKVFYGHYFYREQGAIKEYLDPTEEQLEALYKYGQLKGGYLQLGMGNHHVTAVNIQSIDSIMFRTKFFKM